MKVCMTTRGGTSRPLGALAGALLCLCYKHTRAGQCSATSLTKAPTWGGTCGVGWVKSSWKLPRPDSGRPASWTALGNRWGLVGDKVVPTPTHTTPNTANVSTSQNQITTKPEVSLPSPVGRRPGLRGHRSRTASAESLMDRCPHAASAGGPLERVWTAEPPSLQLWGLG